MCYLYVCVCQCMYDSIKIRTYRLRFEYETFAAIRNGDLTPLSCVVCCPLFTIFFFLVCSFREVAQCVLMNFLKNFLPSIQQSPSSPSLAVSILILISLSRARSHTHTHTHIHFRTPKNARTRFITRATASGIN